MISLLFLLINILPLTRALNWTSTRSQPAFSVAGGEKIRGVNLGGWFILEAWEQPDLFLESPLDQYDVPDEWHYCNILGKTECEKRLDAHWSTWINESDFKQIAALGLNAVRIPIGYWSLDLQEEPYVHGALAYLLKSLTWAKTYNLDVMVDLHGLPGSQNGQDNSGLYGDILWHTNTSNIDRSLNALKLLTANVTDPIYGGVVKAIEVINEPYLQSTYSYAIPWETLAEYYVSAYNTVRAADQGDQEVMIVFHDAFQPVNNWQYFFTNTSLGGSWEGGFGLDTHQYLAFGSDATASSDEQLGDICALSDDLIISNSNWTTIVGEFSLGVDTFCVDYSTCGGSTLAQNTNSSQSTFIREFWETQQDVYESAGGWFFWNWKTQSAPTWNYQYSITQNWIPTNLSDHSWNSYCPSSTYAFTSPSSSKLPSSASSTASYKSPSSHITSSALNAAFQSVTSSSSATQAVGIGSAGGIPSSSSSVSSSPYISGSDTSQPIALILALSLGCLVVVTQCL